ncbi:hypothetical protein BC939DRAFT_478391 [Gamsiella multidivaricata]|uniref:uncharacterized protein n=1 Tax=Gamsiella multidivaricata TaxID=101098 RepID=UPI00221ED453|nr:uncharacterized protein BC939DRAFT_478391 [Gamsiella multidivaricata]KAI7821412.1 hypothetical protein BC939DRAFT_478391 [Gamsiella multidivaricata]
MQRRQPAPYQRAQPKHPSGPSPFGLCSPPTPDQEPHTPIQENAFPSKLQPYTSHAPYSPQIPQALAYPQRVILPSYSTQALKTFAPQQMAYTPDAAMVPIRSLQSEKSFVARRTVRVADMKAFPDKRDSSKQQWLLSFTIKDDFDTIDVKVWQKTRESMDTYSQISLNQVVHIWTDDVKINTKPSMGNHAASAQATSSPLCLNLSEGKVGHRIDFGCKAEMATLFRTALGANAGGVVHSVIIKSKHGPVAKTPLTVFDAQGQEASLTLWGETMGTMVQNWVPFTTTLILSGAQVSMYGLKPQITVGFNTHIQVDPVCKNVEASDCR